MLLLTCFVFDIVSTFIYLVFVSKSIFLHFRDWRKGMEVEDPVEDPFSPTKQYVDDIKGMSRKVKIYLVHLPRIICKTGCDFEEVWVWFLGSNG